MFDELGLVGINILDVHVNLLCMRKASSKAAF